MGKHAQLLILIFCGGLGEHSHNGVKPVLDLSLCRRISVRHEADACYIGYVVVTTITAASEANLRTAANLGGHPSSRRQDYLRVRPMGPNRIRPATSHAPRCGRLRRRVACTNR